MDGHPANPNEVASDCAWGDFAFEGLLLVEMRRIRAANARACALIGVPNQAGLVQRDLRDLFGDDLDDLLAGDIETTVDPVETVLHRPDGGRIDVEILGRPISGNPPQVCLAIREIGDRKSHEAEIRNAHRIEAVGQVAAGLTHEVRNLVTAILGHAKMARLAVAENAAAAASIDAIETAARNIALVTRPLGPIPSATTPPDGPIDIAAVLRADFEKFREWLPATIGLTISLPQSPIWILGERDAIRDITYHLVSNARDAMPNGGTLAVSLNTADGTAADQWCRLTLTDTGVGMSPDVRARVFEPFFTTKPRGLGNGVGLKIVMGLVQRMGGTVEVQSEARRGTSVTITLPLAEPGLPSADAALPVRGRGEVVLIAEDFHLISGLIVSHLRAAGFEPLVFVDGDSAITGYRQHRERIRAALLDIELPGRSGLDCLATIRATDPHLPVIIMSGHADAAAGALDANTEIVRKPFQVKDLIRRVAERISQTSSRDETGGS